VVTINVLMVLPQFLLEEANEFRFRTADLFVGASIIGKLTEWVRVFCIYRSLF
jgi:hypothetical protein